MKRLWTGIKILFSLIAAIFLGKIYYDKQKKKRIESNIKDLKAKDVTLTLKEMELAGKRKLTKKKFMSLKKKRKKIRKEADAIKKNVDALDDEALADMAGKLVNYLSTGKQTEDNQL